MIELNGTEWWRRTYCCRWREALWQLSSIWSARRGPRPKSGKKHNKTKKNLSSLLIIDWHMEPIKFQECQSCLVSESIIDKWRGISISSQLILTGMPPRSAALTESNQRNLYLVCLFVWFLIRLGAPGRLSLKRFHNCENDGSRLMHLPIKDAILITNLNVRPFFPSFLFVSFFFSFFKAD